MNMCHNREAYAPRKVYNRKLARNILRNAVIRKNGNHNVSAIMAIAFKKAHNDPKYSAKLA